MLLLLVHLVCVSVSRRQLRYTPGAVITVSYSLVLGSGVVRRWMLTFLWVCCHLVSDIDYYAPIDWMIGCGRLITRKYFFLVGTRHVLLTLIIAILREGRYERPYLSNIH